MKQMETTYEDDLRSEYDLTQLRVRRLGPGRKRFGDVVRLEPDVAQVFPDADAVNAALRSFIQMTQERESSLSQSKSAA